jgi:hypothetical protein
VNPLTHGKAPALFVASDLDAQVALQVALLEKEEAQDPKDKRVTGFTVLVDPLKNRCAIFRYVNYLVNRPRRVQIVGDLPKLLNIAAWQ